MNDKENINIIVDYTALLSMHSALRSVSYAFKPGDFEERTDTKRKDIEILEEKVFDAMGKFGI